MIIAFRVDASPDIGNGHLERCKNLANVLKLSGHKIIFVSRVAKEISVLELISSGFDVRTFYNDNAISQKEDAIQTLNLLQGTLCDWIVVDNYDLDIIWEEYIKPHVRKLMVIDDMPISKHECDLLLDQNIHDYSKQQKYNDLLNDNCIQLHGPKFALLNSLYASLRSCMPPRENKIQRLLVFFGGADTQGQTLLVLQALKAPVFKHIIIDIVVGSKNKKSEEIMHLAEECSNVTVLSALSSLAALMVRADFFIGAGGGTTWERCCLGLPALVTWVSENQRDSTELLHKKGVHKSLGDAHQLTSEVWKGELLSFINKPMDIALNRNRLIDLVDGMGAARVVAAMIGVSKNISLRYAKYDDVQLLNSFQKKPVLSGNSQDCNEFVSSATTHNPFSDFVDCAEDVIFIAQDETGLPVGYVQINISSEGALIDFRTDDYLDRYELEEKIFEIGLLKYKELIVNNAVDIEQNNNSITSGFIKSASLDANENNSNNKLKLTVLSANDSWLNNRILKILIMWLKRGHEVRWVHRADELVDGDICFVLGCKEILNNKHLSLNKNTLVVHESALPHGRGWSPMSWQVLEGATSIVISLIEAEEGVDTGNIYLQSNLNLNGTELVEELRDKQAKVTMKLCDEWLHKYPSIKNLGKPQVGVDSYYPRRTPLDSKVDPNESISKLFNLLRTVDNKHYPAWFELHGERYRLSIDKDEY
jgi:UDP-2,4-diacetamido-2,4,6-trideoxy-beta-L-altropyranose hydrolase